MVGKLITKSCFSLDRLPEWMSWADAEDIMQWVYHKALTFVLSAQHQLSVREPFFCVFVIQVIH